MTIMQFQKVMLGFRERSSYISLSLELGLLLGLGDPPLTMVQPSHFSAAVVTLCQRWVWVGRSRLVLRFAVEVILRNGFFWMFFLPVSGRVWLGVWFVGKSLSKGRLFQHGLWV